MQGKHILLWADSKIKMSIGKDTEDLLERLAFNSVKHWKGTLGMMELLYQRTVCLAENISTLCRLLWKSFKKEQAAVNTTYFTEFMSQ